MTLPIFGSCRDYVEADESDSLPGWKRDARLRDSWCLAGMKNWDRGGWGEWIFLSKERE